MIIIQDLWAIFGSVEDEKVAVVTFSRKLNQADAKILIDVIQDNQFKVEFNKKMKESTETENINLESVSESSK